MLQTILGIACFDTAFRRALFTDCTAAVRAYSCDPGANDLAVLKVLCNDPSLKECFEAVAGRICTHPPCPPIPTGTLDVIGAALLDKVFLEELFVDPITAAKKHSFVLCYPETYVLNVLIEGDIEAKLKNAMVALSTRIAQVIEDAKLQLAA